MRAFYAGIDVGSLSSECVLVDDRGAVGGFAILPTGQDVKKAASAVFARALEVARLSRAEVKAVVGTGYGRRRVAEADTCKTEITCHARGIAELLPEVRTLIDIGGQDSKAIRLGEGGKVVDFAMNDKCAAGTGRFLEVMAGALGVKLSELGKLAARHEKKLSLSSTCTVFAESEVVSLLSQGHAVADVAQALAESIALRTAALVKRVGVAGGVAMSGGVAKNKAVVAALERVLGVTIAVPAEPQIVGALGAALLAREGFCDADLRVSL